MAEFQEPTLLLLTTVVSPSAPLHITVRTEALPQAPQREKKAEMKQVEGN